MAQLAKPVAQRRSFIAAATALRAGAPKAAAVSTSFQQTRGVKTIDFAGTKEQVYGNHSSHHSHPPQ
jgi:ketol-acid reductoisomerase